MKFYFIVIFICISLVANNSENIFMYLLTICISSLESYLLNNPGIIL